jgi:hypothetical protein
VFFDGEIGKFVNNLQEQKIKEQTILVLMKFIINASHVANNSRFFFTVFHDKIANFVVNQS